MNAIIRHYAKRVLLREIAIDNIPELWRQQVIDFLASGVE